MDYLFVLSLVARNPMYLFSPQCFQPTTSESLLAERTKYIWIAAEAEKALIEYDECRVECDDGDYIDVIRCNHDGLSYGDHKANLQGALNTWLSTVTHIDMLGKKIERLMRKQNRAKA